jgi:hypothetical protein
MISFSNPLNETLKNSALVSDLIHHCKFIHIYFHNRWNLWNTMSINCETIHHQATPLPRRTSRR